MRSSVNGPEKRDIVIMADVASVVLFFPLLFPIWAERPLTREDVFPSPYAVYVTNEKLEFLAAGFEYGDFEMRSRLARNFGMANTPAAARLLLQQLSRESDASVQAAILGQLLNLPLDVAAAAPVIAAWIGNENSDVRYWALRLYGSLPNADAARLVAAAREDSAPLVRAAALAAFPAHADKLSARQLSNLFEQVNEDMQASVVTALCQVPDADQAAALLTAVADSPRTELRYALAAQVFALPEPLAAQVCRRLLSDVHASVRLAAANAAAQIRERSLFSKLVELVTDRDPAVRRTAVASLTAFPDIESANAIASALADEQRLVRREAEEAAVRYQPRAEMIEVVRGMLNHPSVDARERVYSTLGHLNARHVRQEIAAALPKEQAENAIAAALRALGQLRLNENPELVCKYATHRSDVVREAAAYALGQLDGAAARKALDGLSRDRNTDVKLQAIISIGHTGDAQYAARLVEILKDVTPPRSDVLPPGEASPSQHRAVACWAAAKLRPVNRALMDRLVVQSTTPVIPTLTGMVFEGEDVLIAACLALTECARADAWVRPLAEKVVRVHSWQPAPGEILQFNPNRLTPSPEVREAARQARVYVEGEAIEPALRPTRMIPLLYRRYEEGE
jgi:HEAT repeat protein